MSRAVTEIVVGIAFVLGVTLLGAYTIVISGVNLGPRKLFVVDFEKVYGLKAGDAVRVEGFEKGEVKSMRLLEDGKVRAVLEVTSDVDIYREGSEVRVTPFSPLGGRVVEIKRGRKGRGKYDSFASADEVNEDLVIQGEAEGELLQTLNRLVEENRRPIGEIVENLRKVTEQLTKTNNILGYLINDEDGAAKIQSVATNLSNASKRIDNILGRVERGEGLAGAIVKKDSKLQRDAEGLVSAGRSTLESTTRLLDTAEEGNSMVGVLVSEDDEMSAATRGIVTDVRGVTHKVNSGSGSLGKLINDDALYDHAAKTAENLESITHKVDEGQGLLSVLLYDEDAGNNARRTIRNLASITDAVDDPNAGTLGLLVHDERLRRRLVRISEEVEGLIGEFRDSLEDVREQAPVNAFIGAVFSAF